MKMLLTRNRKSEFGIFGVLEPQANTGEIVLPFVTLEHAYPGHSGFEPKVPDGIYRCVKGHHTLKSGRSYETFELEHVPGHSGILFHPGNFQDESEGCILIGDKLGDTGHFIIHSVAAFERFQFLTQNIRSFTLTIVSKC